MQPWLGVPTRSRKAERTGTSWSAPQTLEKTPRRCARLRMATDHGFKGVVQADIAGDAEIGVRQAAAAGTSAIPVNSRLYWGEHERRYLPDAIATEGLRIDL